MTTGKLDDKLEDKSSIKFTNYAINKFQGNFEKVKGKNISARFENSGVRGLKLFQFKASKRKYFYQQLLVTDGM